MKSKRPYLHDIVDDGISKSHEKGEKIRKNTVTSTIENVSFDFMDQI